MQPQLDAGAGEAKSRDPRQHPFGDEGGVGREDDGLAFSARAQGLHAGFQRVEAFAQGVEKPQARRRQHQLPRHAPEQRLAQRALETAHLMADGGGRDRELGRGALEAGMRRSGLEGAQRGQRRQAPGRPDG
jgi:hypothetical protein